MTSAATRSKPSAAIEAHRALVVLVDVEDGPVQAGIPQVMQADEGERLA